MLAHELAAWALALEPTPEDLELAERSLRDTVAVAIGAASDPIRALTAELRDAARWASLAHVLDYDDLHLPSTTHPSAVCVPAALAAGGDARSYLAGAGTMARLGTMLGWAHYAAGWHATATAGAPAAAVAAGVALGLDEQSLASAIALAIPAAGGVRRSFGTQAKALQVGFSAAAGVRAAQLAARGASADAAALEQWIELVGGGPHALSLEGPAVPGGLAIKLYPCCYALQRPLAAATALGPRAAREIERILVHTPADALEPLPHHRPQTGLEGKFSLEYAVAAAFLDGHPGPDSFTDAAVARPEAQALLRRVEVDATPGGGGLLAGECHLRLELADGERLETSLDLPPGAPACPATAAQLEQKAEELGVRLEGLDWDNAAQRLD